MSGDLFTQTQVEELLRRVGFRPRQAKIGSAIAMCEAPASLDGKQYANSAAVGDQALADDVWGYSYGMFQVRSMRAEKGTGGWRDEDELSNPTFNARAARYIKRSAGWKAWSTYTSGMYKAYLPEWYPAAPGTHVVLAGENLSVIAAEEGVADWHLLAKWNGLTDPYTIFIGQVLLLTDHTGV